MTNALTSVVYLSLLTAGLVLGDTEQRVAAVVVAAVVLAQVALRRRGTAAPRAAAAPGRAATSGLTELSSAVTPLAEG
jgi:hypothetical protein